MVITNTKKCRYVMVNIVVIGLLLCGASEDLEECFTKIKNFLKKEDKYLDDLDLMNATDKVRVMFFIQADVNPVEMEKFVQKFKTEYESLQNPIDVKEFFFEYRFLNLMGSYFGRYCESKIDELAKKKYEIGKIFDYYEPPPNTTKLGSTKFKILALIPSKIGSERIEAKIQYQEDLETHQIIIEDFSAEETSVKVHKV